MTRFFRIAVRVANSLRNQNAPNVDLDAAKKLIDEYANSDPRVLCLVPISEIKQSSTYMDDETMEGYANLLEGSEIPPPELEIDRRGRLSINDGSHRIKAAEKLGFTYVPALVPANYSGIDKLVKI